MSFKAGLLRELDSRKETDASLDKKLEVWRIVNQKVKAFQGEARAFLFGSCMTGFSLKGGDLDIVILFARPMQMGKEDKYNFLKNLKDFWQTKESSRAHADKWINSQTELFNANVPIISIVNPDGIKIDITVAGDELKHEGIRNTHLLMCYAAIDDCVAKLTVLVKSWANHHNLVGAFNNRLSSYSYTLMVIFFLQTKGLLPTLQDVHPSAFDPSRSVIGQMSYDMSRQDWILKSFTGTPRTFNGKYGDARLGDLLVEFFLYYSSFQFSHDVISVRKGSSLRVANCLAASSVVGCDPRDWTNKEFFIEEPFKRDNVARHTKSRIEGMKIKSLIQETAARLDRDKSIRSIFFA